MGLAYHQIFIILSNTNIKIQQSKTYHLSNIVATVVERDLAHFQRHATARSWRRKWPQPDTHMHFNWIELRWNDSHHVAGGTFYTITANYTVKQSSQHVIISIFHNLLLHFVEDCLCIWLHSHTAKWWNTIYVGKNLLHHTISYILVQQRIRERRTDVESFNYVVLCALAGFAIRAKH